MKKFLIIPFIVFALTSCDDEKFLRERPGDFMTAENSYLNAAQFRTGLNTMYIHARRNYNYRDSHDDYFHFGSGTDLFFRPVPLDDPFSEWQYITPSYGIYNVVWERHFQMITFCNILLQQSENEEVTWTSEREKLEIQAEARFFRGYAYRYLGCLFGGVPVLREPVIKPELGFTRNTRQEVYELCVEDFEFAAKNLPESVTEPGRVVKAAAYHYLSEMYIALGDEMGGSQQMYENAVKAASEVIEGNVGEYRLMTERHGWRANVDGKDAFWDLFQMKSLNGFSNFSYQTGNKESIWVIQVDKYAIGGLDGSLNSRTNQARVFWPSIWAWNKFGYDNVARDWMGRGVGWLRGTNYAFYDLWEKSGANDRRNHEHNIQHVFFSPDPMINGQEVANYDTTYYTAVTLRDGREITVETKPGDVIKKEWLTTAMDTLERGFPRIMKLGSDWHYNQDPSNGFVMESYAIRLAETYLVRAEAHMKAGDLPKAAADINTVRARSNADPITASDVDIDYILDERARELIGEEMRTLTLCRLGLLYDRTKRFGFESSARSVTERNNLCPIPQKVIDDNTLANFPNNPGY